MAKNIAPMMFAVCVLVAVSCGASPTAPAQTLPVTAIASFDADGGTFAAETMLAIRDLPTWQNLWTQLNTGRVPQLPLPTVDFTTEMLAVVAMGVKPTTGFQVSVAGASEQQGRVTVDVLETSPGLCVTGQVLTAPVIVSKLPVRPGPVTFKVTRRIVDCGS
jgi:PrcB C-terminal